MRWKAVRSRKPMVCVCWSDGGHRRNHQGEDKITGCVGQEKGGIVWVPDSLQKAGTDYNNHN